MMVYPEQDQGKFEELIQRFCPSLKKMVGSLNNYLRYVDDNDLMQEAFSHLWIRYREGELKDKTDSYILRSCYFHLKNLLRKTREKAEVISLSTPIDEEGTTLEEIMPDETQRPANSIEVKLFINQVRENGLTKREKETLRLYLQGYTVRGIGQKLGVSHVRIVRLKENICRKYREEYLAKT